MEQLTSFPAQNLLKVPGSVPGSFPRVLNGKWLAVLRGGVPSSPEGVEGNLEFSSGSGGGRCTCVKMEPFVLLAFSPKFYIIFHVWTVSL